MALLDNENVMEGKVENSPSQLINKVQTKNLGIIANYIFFKEEDLSLEDLNKLFNELLHI
uniref:Uncharacterized protein n=1 Tax=Aegilops tauschii TaxID=37682 RepID=M8CNT2_AEGTA